MKAIETRYASCRFRSRLEARWAVFFDHAQIPWKYELEGFQLDSGWYLPDFYLPQVGAWIEVKGGEISKVDQAKVIEFGFKINQEREEKIRVLSDIPRGMFNLHAVLGEDFPHETTAIECLSVVAAPEWPFGGKDIYLSQGRTNWLKKSGIQDPSIVLHNGDNARIGDYRLQPGIWVHPNFLDRALFLNSLEAGRSARFEHGESGAARV